MTEAVARGRMHKALVSLLVEDGWQTRRFFQALCCAFSHLDDPGRKIACVHGKAHCNCPPCPDAIDGCLYALWRYELPNCGIPDAFRIDADEGCVWLAEVNVSHPADASKWARLWDVLDSYGWDLRLVVVDRHGNRSCPTDERLWWQLAYVEPMRAEGLSPRA